MSTTTHEQLAQETAEYIAHTLVPRSVRLASYSEITIHYPKDENGNDRRPPTDVEEIKATLLDGRFWISWMDDRVTAAMRTLHGEPGESARPWVP
jgi:hypothetical protein